MVIILILVLQILEIWMNHGRIKLNIILNEVYDI